MKNCNKCIKDISCGDCDKPVNQNKKFSANVNESKKQLPSEFGHTLPKYITT